MHTRIHRYVHTYVCTHQHAFPFFSRLNAVREVSARCPLVMSSDLLQDLAGYKKHREKCVYVMVAMDALTTYCGSIFKLNQVR